MLLYSDDSDGANQRPRSRSVQGSPQLSPLRTLEAEYDLETQGSSRENRHSKNHSRFVTASSASAPMKHPLRVFFYCSDVKLFFLTTLDRLLKLSLGGFDLRFGQTGYLSRHVLRPHSFPHSSSAFSLLFCCFFCTPLRKPHLYRLAFESQEAPHYYQNPREASSSHSSPFKTLPRPPRDPRSMPPTPVMTRNAYSSSQLRCDHCSLHLCPPPPLPPQPPHLTSPQTHACLPPSR